MKPFLRKHALVLWTLVVTVLVICWFSIYWEPIYNFTLPDQNNAFAKQIRKVSIIEREPYSLLTKDYSEEFQNFPEWKNGLHQLYALWFDYSWNTPAASSAVPEFIRSKQENNKLEDRYYLLELYDVDENITKNNRLSYHFSTRLREVQFSHEKNRAFYYLLFNGEPFYFQMRKQNLFNEIVSEKKRIDPAKWPLDTLFPAKIPYSRSGLLGRSYAEYDVQFSKRSISNDLAVSTDKPKLIVLEENKIFELESQLNEVNFKLQEAFIIRPQAAYTICFYFSNHEDEASVWATDLETQEVIGSYFSAGNALLVAAKDRHSLHLSKLIAANASSEKYKLVLINGSNFRAISEKFMMWLLGEVKQYDSKNLPLTKDETKALLNWVRASLNFELNNSELEQIEDQDIIDLIEELQKN